MSVPFVVAPPDVSEQFPDRVANPEQLAQTFALQKAQSAAERHPNASLLGADTIVVLNGRVMGKPRDAKQAREMLLALRDRPHRVTTGLAFISPALETPQKRCVSTTVTMRHYSSDEIDRYVSSGDPLDKAGAYAVQSQSFHPAERVDGCYFNVVGLPVCELVEMLAKIGLASRPDASLVEACQHSKCPLGRMTSQEMGII